MIGATFLADRGGFFSNGISMVNAPSTGTICTGRVSQEEVGWVQCCLTAEAGDWHFREARCQVLKAPRTAKQSESRHKSGHEQGVSLDTIRYGAVCTRKFQGRRKGGQGLTIQAITSP